jgi:hypothetical protein
MTLPVTTGVELEFWVVDDEGRLTDGRDLADDHAGVEPEFVGPLVEVKTEPHGSAAALARDLRETVRDLLLSAEADGRHLVPLGTPLTSAAPAAEDRRGELFEEIYGDGVRPAKNCAGTHVHLEKGNVRRQLNLLTALDPALALTASSPYYCGDRTMASSRAFAYRTDCGSDFREFCGLWEYVDSVDEWHDRVDDAYETFRDLAAEQGVSPDEVDEHFCPEDAVLNPVRLRREQPTVEWRAPDTALPSQVLRLATDVAELVGHAERLPLERGAVGIDADRVGIPEFQRLKRLSREAIGVGLRSDRIPQYLDVMGFDPTEYDPLCTEIRGPPTITEERARAIRLRYADRLRADLSALSPAGTADTDGLETLQTG